VLVSGEGTNLQAILDSLHGRDGIEVVAVASNRPEARALRRASAAGIETEIFAAGGDRDARDAALADWLERREVDLLVLAGFTEILGGLFIRRFEGRIVNVHPSLLPAFAGMRAVEQALAYGVRVMGVTVHFVDEGVDSGPVILQEAFEVPYPRAIEAVEREVHEVEHRLLPQAVSLIAAGDVSIDSADSRTVRIREGRDG